MSPICRLTAAAGIASSLAMPAAAEMTDDEARAVMTYAECISRVAFELIKLPENRDGNIDLIAQTAMTVAQEHACRDESVSAVNAVMTITGSDKEADNMAALSMVVLALQGSLKAYAREHSK